MNKITFSQITEPFTEYTKATKGIFTLYIIWESVGPYPRYIYCDILNYLDTWDKLCWMFLMEDKFCGLFLLRDVLVDISWIRMWERKWNVPLKLLNWFIEYKVIKFISRTMLDFQSCLFLLVVIAWSVHVIQCETDKWNEFSFSIIVRICKKNPEKRQFSLL